MKQDTTDMNVTSSIVPTEAAAYRQHLLPLISKWQRERPRVAIFGIGQHTSWLFEAVPELDGPWVTAFLESVPAGAEQRYRGRPVRSLAWADDNADVVICSSYVNELAQMQLLAHSPVKVIFSRPVVPETPAVPNTPQGILVPAEPYVIDGVEDDRAPVAAIQALFERHEDDMRALVSRLRPHFTGLQHVGRDSCPAPEPFWNNGFFSGDDARVAYAMVREMKPSRILEVGSGHSTRFMRRAIRDGNLDTRLISIDPCPRADVSAICDEQIPAPVQRAPMRVFESLRAGDFLFIDSSHLVFQGSDCPHLFLRVLPMLPAGVWVHVHDIFLPDGYPPHFDERLYNEQPVVAALLLDSVRWMPRLPVRWLRQRGILENGGCSFWMIARNAG